jgi:hypothetical protein
MATVASNPRRFKDNVIVGRQPVSNGHLSPRPSTHGAVPMRSVSTRIVRPKEYRRFERLRRVAREYDVPIALVLAYLLMCVLLLILAAR